MLLFLHVLVHMFVIYRRSGRLKKCMCEVGQVTAQEELEAFFLAVDRGSVDAADLVVFATDGLARFLVQRGSVWSFARACSVK